MSNRPAKHVPSDPSSTAADAVDPWLTPYRPAERRLALVGIMLCMFLSALDQTIVSTALPRIIAELNGLDRYAWVATAYLLATVVALPIFGRLTELMAAKWVFTTAAAIFLSGSALCGLSPTMNALIAFRGLQGLGGGGLFATTVTTLGLLYPPRERGRVQGIFGAVFAVSSILGPWVGGLLTDHLNWRWVFYVNMPVGLVALYFLFRHMPLLAPSRRSSFDLPGAITVPLWTVPLILACSWGGSTYPWTSPRILGLFALAAVGLVLFVVVERRRPQPLFDLSLFANPTFRWAVIALIFVGGTFLGSMMFLPLYLVQVKGFSASNSGLSLTPLTFGTMMGSLLAGQMVSRTGRYKPLLLVSAAASAAICLLLHEILRVDTPLWQVILLMVVMGFIFGPSMPLYPMAVQNSVGRERLGTASSATQFFRQVGSTVGVALLGTVLSGSLQAGMAQHLPPGLQVVSQEFHVQEGMAGQMDLEGRVRQQFQQLEAVIQRALQGDEQAYRQLQADPRIPAAFKEQLPEGGIPAQVEAQLAPVRRALQAAMAGDDRALGALRGNPALPPALRSLLERLPADATQRQAVLAEALRQLDRYGQQVTAQAQQQAWERIHQEMEQQAQQLAVTLKSAVNQSITDALRQVYLYTALMAVLAMVCVAFLPDQELRGRVTKPVPAVAEE